MGIKSLNTKHLQPCAANKAAQMDAEKWVLHGSSVMPKILQLTHTAAQLTANRLISSTFLKKILRLPFSLTATMAALSPVKCLAWRSNRISTSNSNHPSHLKLHRNLKE